MKVSALGNLCVWLNSTFFVQVRWYIGNSLNTDNFSINVYIITTAWCCIPLWSFHRSLQNKTTQPTLLAWSMANLALSYNLTDPSLQRMKKQLKRRRGFRGKIFLTKKRSRKNRIYVLSSCLTNWIHSAVKCISGFKRKIEQTTIIFNLYSFQCTQLVNYKYFTYFRHVLGFWGDPLSVSRICCTYLHRA